MASKKLPILAVVALVVVGVVVGILSSGLLGPRQAPPGSSVVPSPSESPADSGREPLGGNVVSSVNVAVYSDAGASVVCSNVDWGDLTPGSTATRTVYVKNTGDVSETLSVAATGWNPTGACDVLTFGWNREGTVLAAGEVVPATFSLTAPPRTGDLSSFGFNIVVSGTAS